MYAFVQAISRLSAAGITSAPAFACQVGQVDERHSWVDVPVVPLAAGATRHHLEHACMTSSVNVVANMLEAACFRHVTESVDGLLAVAA